MSIFQNLWDVLGLGTPVDDSEYEDELEETLPNDAEWQGNYASDAKQSSASGNVIGMPTKGGSQTEMLLIEPRSFEEIPYVVSALKQRKAVVLNLGLMDADTAQRCVDFVAGGAFAIDGHQQRVGETIFLFTPSFVQISNYSPSELGAIEKHPITAPRRPPTPTPWTNGDTHIAQSL